MCKSIFFLSTISYQMGAIAPIFEITYNKSTSTGDRDSRNLCYLKIKKNSKNGFLII